MAWDHSNGGAAEGTAAGSRQGADVLTVAQAMQVVKGALGKISLTIRGEVSELSNKPGYKAVYFTVSDGSAALPCLIWNSDYRDVEVEPRLGMLVEVSGYFSIYAKTGRMNFTVRTIRKAGTGDIRQQVAERARKLQREGLMDPSRKRPLPMNPECIAVVTSPRGKAVHDCIRTLRRRWPLAEVFVCGVAVEGERAPSELIHGLEVAETSGAQVILLVRGGGSYEDLMPFNDEALARKVASCAIPVVTGIGHEPDNSICDMVSDLRCSTPTAAAEAVVGDRAEMALQLDSFATRLAQGLQHSTAVHRGSWERIASQPLFRMPDSLVQGHLRHLDLAAARLERIPDQILVEKSRRLDDVAQRLSRAIPEGIARDTRRVDMLGQRLATAARRAVDPFESEVALRASRLEDLSPLSVLSRGYGIVYGDDGSSIVDSVDEVTDGEMISVRVRDGRIHASVIDHEKDDTVL